jgi:Ser-tRNA(Ala) deacylase AlaX
MPRRIHNAKLHSAGHLIDCAIKQLNVPVKPTKGYHFSEGPYVEYEGEIANAQEMVQAVQEKLDALIAADIPIERSELSYEQALEKGIKAPEGKAARIVCIKGFEACGCGGTHITSTKQLGSIIIRKIKSKGGNTRISYEVR